MIAAQEIVAALSGKWRGSYGMVKCVAHADRTPSLRIRQGDTGVPLVHCFSGCPPEAIITALSRLSLWPERDRKLPRARARATRTYAAPTSAENHTSRTDDELARMRAARDMWLTTIPAAGTILDTYWHQARGIEIAIPSVIRFGAAIPYGWNGAAMPAMVAKVQAPDGRFAGIHVTYLDPDGRRKASGVPKTKLIFGCVGLAAIRLSEADHHMAIGEGIETTASYMQSSGLAGWAAMSTSGVRALGLPPLPLACRVTLLGENDANGASRAAIDAATARMRLDGRMVETAWPSEEYNDFNDPFRKDRDHGHG
jgi:putative DNA primase/helicase